MRARVLHAAHVRTLFSFADAIAVLARAFESLHAGVASMPSRGVLRVGPSADDVQVLTMPAHTGGNDPVVVKLSTIAPRNTAKDLPLIHALVAVVDASTGSLLALIEGASLTALRTAAVSALATHLLARRDARHVALVGAGEQARVHLEAMCAVREVEVISIYSRTQSRARTLADWAATAFPGLRVNVCDTIDEVVAGADIVCTATSTASPVPVLAERHVRDGMHVNAIGGVDETACELPPSVLAAAYTVVDERDAALREAGEVIQAISSGAITRDSVIELGAVVAGRASARQSAQQITIFKSVGVGVADAAIAAMLYQKAASANLGEMLCG